MELQEFYILVLVTAAVLSTVFIFLQLKWLLSKLQAGFYSRHNRNPQLYSVELEAEQAGSPDEVNKLNGIVAELQRARQELEEQKTKMEEALLLVEKDNYRKTEELLEAQQLQLSMLPQHTPFYPGYEISLFSEPATEVGGDYYDYRFRKGGKILHLVLGDATGHGFKPAVLVATAKSYFQTQVGHSSNESLLSAISKAIRSLNTKGLYMGLCLLEMDRDLISVTSSGMPPVYYYNAKKGFVEQCLFKGMFLGIAEVNKGKQRIYRMHKGDVLLLMTDGLAELRNRDRELLGYKAVKEAIACSIHKGSSEIINDLLKLGRSWVQGQEGQQDDISMVVIKKR